MQPLAGPRSGPRTCAARRHRHRRRAGARGGARRRQGVPVPPADVAAFVAEKMDYLCTSRPTAVNLGEAVERLKALANGISDGRRRRAEKVIAECEGMLAADVAANRAIGAFGADALCAAVGERRRRRRRGRPHPLQPARSPWRGLRHRPRRRPRAGARERLPPSTSTVTRPGRTSWARASPRTRLPSRCPAAPPSATPPPPSSMSQRQGGRRRRRCGPRGGRGDTAQQDRHLQPRHRAHHGVPFFVAAPISTLDPSTERGSDDRHRGSPVHAEITLALGTRVAAEGVDVWNPSFDVPRRTHRRHHHREGRHEEDRRGVGFAVGRSSPSATAAAAAAVASPPGAPLG